MLSYGSKKVFRNWQKLIYQQFSEATYSDITVDIYTDDSSLNRYHTKMSLKDVDEIYLNFGLFGKHIQVIFQYFLLFKEKLSIKNRFGNI